MSEDLTQKLPTNENDNEILTAIKDLDTKVTTRFQTVEQKVDGLEKKVDGLQKKVDERLHDTRPIWHKVVADIAELQAGQKRLEEGQHAIRSDISEVTSSVNNVKRDQIVVNDVVRRLQMDFITVNEWLRKVVVDRNQQNSST